MAESCDQHLNEEPIAPSSNYGWIRIAKITNNTNRIVQFKNPEIDDKTREIKAGEKDENACQGYIPYYSCDKRYEISYFNEQLGKTVNIEIKDLGGSWEASFRHNLTVQDGKLIEDVRILEPTTGVSFNAHILMNTDGLEVIEYFSNHKRAQIRIIRFG